MTDRPIICRSNHNWWITRWYVSCFLACNLWEIWMAGRTDIHKICLFVHIALIIIWPSCMCSIPCHGMAVCQIPGSIQLFINKTKLFKLWSQDRHQPKMNVNVNVNQLASQPVRPNQSAVWKFWRHCDYIQLDRLFTTGINTFTSPLPPPFSRKEARKEGNTKCHHDRPVLLRIGFQFCLFSLDVIKDRLTQ